MMPRMVLRSPQSHVPRSSILPVPVRLALFPMLIGFFLSAAAMAQSASITVGSASGFPGAALNIPVTFAPGSTNVSTLQFDLMFSSSLAYASATTGSAAAAASKSASAKAVSGRVRVLVFGLNQNVIGPGVIAEIRLNISPGTIYGFVPIAITGIVASDDLANPVLTVGIGGSVQVLDAADTTPPTISAVSSSDPSDTSVTITWTTNKAANSQVEYGTTTGYGSSALNRSLVTSHSQTLTELAENTLYHYRVKSRDAAGNLATSGDYTFTTGSTPRSNEPPAISDITVSNITSKSATISWTTDKPADSEVEYRGAGINAKTVALRTPAIGHSLTLNQLKRLSEYTFVVKSTDAGGRQAVGSEFRFTTTQDGAPALVLPRFSPGQSMLGPDTMAGIGLVNLDFAPENVAFTAVEGDGTLVAGNEIANPVALGLNGNEQRPLVDSQLFGDGLLNSNSNGYIKLEGTNEDTRGLFLIFDADLKFQDGANLSDTKLANFVFSEIQADGYNKISIINNNQEQADLTIDLVSRNGVVRSSVSEVIPGNGSLTADLFGDLFIGINPVATDYVRVRSSNGVQPFQVMRQKSGDLAMLPGQDLTVGGTVLYSPLYAFGENYRTSLTVVNLDSVPGTVTLRFVSGDGISFNTSRSMVIPAKGKLYIDDPSFFMRLDPKVLTRGYVEIRSDGVRLAGSTMLGDIQRESFSAALALVSDLQMSVLYSHVVSNDLYFTGISILNPDTTPATVRLDLYAADGTLRETKSILIGAGQRQSRLLREYFPSLEGQNQTSGYVRLSSNIPVASFAAFGTRNLSMISAIPPQITQ